MVDTPAAEPVSDCADWTSSRASWPASRCPPSGSGPLDGLSFAVKDLIDVAGRTTGCGNPSWRASHPPAAVHAVCVEQLLRLGAHCVGTTVSDELAFSLLGRNHYDGTPLNPRAPDRVAGGSSSGSASAVACGLVRLRPRHRHRRFRAGSRQQLRHPGPAPVAWVPLARGREPAGAQLRHGGGVGLPARGAAAGGGGPAGQRTRGGGGAGPGPGAAGGLRPGRPRGAAGSGGTTAEGCGSGSAIGCTR